MKSILLKTTSCQDALESVQGLESKFAVWVLLESKWWMVINVETADPDNPKLDLYDPTPGFASFKWRDGQRFSPAGLARIWLVGPR